MQDLNPQQKKLQQTIEKDGRRRTQHQSEERSILGQTIFLGTLGLLMVIPIVGGAYLGHWLDSRETGFSFSWTVTLIILGAVWGAFNVIYFIREH